MDSRDLVENYLHKKDWRVSESSSAPYSYGAMTRYMSNEVFKDYWLRYVYPEYITTAYREGFMHIHDLGFLAPYCCGYSLGKVLNLGVQGIPNVPKSKPAKHFSAVLNQLTNLATLFQNEIAGAVAFSSVDTLLAPFIKEDGLDYEQVKQNIQNFVFSLNSNSRMGAEPAFTNITLDLTIPEDLMNNLCTVGGTLQDYTYAECQKEMNLFNKAFFEVMLEGDADGEPFSYPIPTYNIHKRFDWDNPNNELLWKLAGLNGAPYFANFGPNSDMDPSDARSMCCRLRLDKRELLKRNGGLFGAGDSTGSVGVVTINLPRIAYESGGDIDHFYFLLNKYMDYSRDSLEIKRAFLEDEIIGNHCIPAFETYIGTLNNHFSTIGYVGMNEACINFFKQSMPTMYAMGEKVPQRPYNILDDEGKKFCLDILDFMREKLADYQVETGNLYNLEATPAESTCYRLAKLDREKFADIFTQGTSSAPYYTNSCHIPVNMVKNVWETTKHQDALQVKHTGGTVVHFYLDGPISGDMVKHMTKTLFEEFALPYISWSPVNCYCPEHGMLMGNFEYCPKCHKRTKRYQRITGYRRNIDFFNPGKAAEFRDRAQYKDSNGSFDNLQGN